MTGQQIAIFWITSLFAAAAFFTYWYFRIDRGHRRRMAAIAAAEAEDRRRLDQWQHTRSDVEAITAAIAQLPSEEVAQVRAWLDKRAERALAEHQAGLPRPL